LRSIGTERLLRIPTSVTDTITLTGESLKQFHLGELVGGIEYGASFPDHVLVVGSMGDVRMEEEWAVAVLVVGQVGVAVAHAIAAVATMAVVEVADVGGVVGVEDAEDVVVSR
jgi:hypothetical protein